MHYRRTEKELKRRQRQKGVWKQYQHLIIEWAVRGCCSHFYGHPPAHLAIGLTVICFPNEPFMPCIDVDVDLLQVVAVVAGSKRID